MQVALPQDIYDRRIAAALKHGRSANTHREPHISAIAGWRLQLKAGPGWAQWAGERFPRSSSRGTARHYRSIQSFGELLQGDPERPTERPQLHHVNPPFTTLAFANEGLRLAKLGCQLHLR